MAAQETTTHRRVYVWFAALEAEDTALMDDLLAHGLPVDVSHPLRHTTALMEVTRRGRTALVQWLLARGAAPAFLCGFPQGTPLHCGIRRQNWECVRLLIEAAAHCDITDGAARTPLHLLATEASAGQPAPTEALATAQLLLARRCPLNALDAEGATALHYCVINNYVPLAELLLMQGADPNVASPTGVTPLTIAALEKNLPLAELLLRFGADARLPMKDGATPLSIMPQLARLSPPYGAPPTTGGDDYLHARRG